MSNTLYLECNSGISGDMMVAALLDLGASEEVLMKALDSIPADGFSVEVTRVKKAGVDCCDFAVLLDAEYENHDHDMEYLHGCEHHRGEEHKHGHPHGEEHEHHHGEEHKHHHEHPHGHAHVHRGMKEIREIIDTVKMTDRAKELALRIFGIIAEAEAKAHAVPVEQVHFHEVGAIDSIVDVVAAAVCLDDLHIENVVVPKLCEGTGTVRCQHGVLPVPVPAVTNIVEQSGLNLEIMDMQGEFVTPTGAAIAAAVKTIDVLPKAFRIVRTGIGAGKRTYERPSILRVMIIEPAENRGDTIWKLESNIDDCSGEILGYVMDLLFEAGARDVHYHPVHMKKNRPAWQLNVICDKAVISRMEEIIFRETTTIGIRRMQMERTVLARECRDVKTSIGQVQVKVCRYGDENKYYPEYESVKELCRTSGRSYRDIYQEAVAACRELYGSEL